MNDVQKSFVEALKPAVVSVSKKTGIVPSVILAQAILESAWGTSKLAKEANNLFGIKVGQNWQGETFEVETREVRNGTSVTEKASFRSYKSVADSVTDYGNFFTSTPWRTKNYQEFRIATNYVDAANALQKSGYATDPQYSEKIKSVIERYALNKLDS
ncbi:TPA: glucosaminidase domain-containing protein [Streptococcus suis]|nr:glucosaminidase domain-containing protein [Streptococcus suis]